MHIVLVLVQVNQINADACWVRYETLHCCYLQ